MLESRRCIRQGSHSHDSEGLISPRRFDHAKYRLLALDIDGTLLDREGTLRDSTVSALRDAETAGMKLVLCTGRRYRKARVIAEMLGLDAPLVCNSGAIVKDPLEHRTLWRADFEPSLLSSILEVFHERNEPVVSFTDVSVDEPDFLVEHPRTGREHFDNYLERNQGHEGVIPGWTTTARLGEGFLEPHFHLCGIGTVTEMLDFERVLLDRLPYRIRTFVQKSPKYTGTMCEVLHHDANKWTAVLQIAKLWGIDRSEIVAVGDDMNDLPMIIGAGLGVAMGHAPEVVRLAADHVTGDHDNDGVGMIVRQLLNSNA